MDQSPPKNVAIIGAGLSGLSLALTLHAQSIPCTIYELRQKSYDLGGGIMLSPNALRVLDALKVYGRLQAKGYNFEHSDFKNEQGETTGTYYFGHEQLYGYKALRIYRQTLIEELRAMCEEQNISIHYEKRFSHVISESAEGVKFELGDGSVETASLLVGADGIHSKVRQYIVPGANPKYSGFVSISASVSKDKLQFPPDWDVTCPISISAKAGAFILAPQGVNGEEYLAGTQRAFPQQDRLGWEKVASSKEELLRLLREHQDSWPEFVQSVMKAIEPNYVSIWPFYAIPKLETWASSGSRVIIVGDAAHAIPPTAGQGVNQAFEDVYSLGLLLSNLSSAITLEAALKFWQTYRQERVGKVLALTDQMNTLRLPAEERAKAVKDTAWDDSRVSGADGQLRWLYEPVLDNVVSEWVSKQ
ncbi:MAG: hypothetical protein Q9191_003513 [Dirinaria sp. TL-2023a]